MAAKLHYRTLPFTIRSEDVAKDGSHFKGYAAVHHNIDEYGTIMGRGCFDRDIDHFRKDGFIGGLNHNWDQPLGKPDEIRCDERGLFVGAPVVDTAHGQDVRKLLKAGVVRKMSFGFEDLDKRYLDQPEDVQRYWDSVGYEPTDEDKDRAKHGALLFTRLRVHEASPVMVPGNRAAEITEVRERKRGIPLGPPTIPQQGGDAGPDPETVEDDDDEVMCVQKDGRWFVKKDGKTHPPEGFETKGEAEEYAKACTKPSRCYLSFEIHSLAARDAVEDFCHRAEQLAELRLTQGRSIPPERRAILRQIRDRADRALAACQPRAKRSDVAGLLRDLFEIESSVLRP